MNFLRLDLLLRLAAHSGVLGKDSILDLYPWIPDFLALCAGLGLVGLLYFLFRPARGPRGFTIDVDDQDVIIRGDFPPAMEQTVVEFLREDCGIDGSYQVRGHWEGSILVVVVRGENARPMEQRIRNFLKLNLKPRRPAGADYS
jgi:hypothetical protein